MEAKVLRAALSAAIRVTVSGSLLGCGGVTSGEPGAPGAGPGTTHEPAQQAPASGGKPASYPATQPVNTAGSQTQPMAGGSGAVVMGGSGGEPSATGGAAVSEGGVPAVDPTPSCGGPALQGCDALFDELAINPPVWPDPLEPATAACCQALADALDTPAPNQLDLECHDELDARLNMVRADCCRSVGFQGQACAPWGPPVPPELELEELLAWGAAA